MHKPPGEDRIGECESDIEGGIVRCSHDAYGSHKRKAELGGRNTAVVHGGFVNDGSVHCACLQNVRTGEAGMVHQTDIRDSKRNGATTGGFLPIYRQSDIAAKGRHYALRAPPIDLRHVA